MSKDIQKKAEKTEATSEKKETKKPIRRAAIENPGRLYFDEKYKKPGKVYRVVNDTPGRVKYLESLGYEIVRDEMKIGEDTVDNASSLGSALTMDVGKHKSQPAVVMECDEDIYNERQALKAEENTAMFEDSKASGQYKGQDI